jgi:hypothetical protein
MIYLFWYNCTYAPDLIQFMTFFFWVVWLLPSSKREDKNWLIILITSCAAASIIEHIWSGECYCYCGEHNVPLAMFKDTRFHFTINLHYFANIHICSPFCFLILLRGALELVKANCDVTKFRWGSVHVFLNMLQFLTTTVILILMALIQCTMGEDWPFITVWIGAEEHNLIESLRMATLIWQGMILPIWTIDCLYNRAVKFSRLELWQHSVWALIIAASLLITWASFSIPPVADPLSVVFYNSIGPLTGVIAAMSYYQHATYRVRQVAFPMICWFVFLSTAYFVLVAILILFV